MTSLSGLAGRAITVDEVRPLIRRHLAARFDLDFVPAPEGIAGTGAGVHVA